ncbi:tail fiber protein [Synechococcus virus S-PRM1]|uniref:Putative tail fiber-like protein n=1 Tax=Synechococcus virus S-PRM1 TaxID=2100130 RepID=A0A346FKD6_9CAUD|nr:tail fiber protein [Synechococcus virus S-PRM1]AXN58441.1 putative tail fiber-like protein [Synechococcus virus S-PRM1]
MDINNELNEFFSYIKQAKQQKKEEIEAQEKEYRDLVGDLSLESVLADYSAHLRGEDPPKRKAKEVQEDKREKQIQEIDSWLTPQVESNDVKDIVNSIISSNKEPVVTEDKTNDDVIDHALRILEKVTTKEEVQTNTTSPEISKIRRELENLKNIVAAQGGGGEVNLKYLDDVSITSVANHDVLVYNNSTEKWENEVGVQRLILDARNNTGSTLAAGTPVYQTGYNSGQDRITIAAADANVSSTMPAKGVVCDPIANNTNGFIVVYGEQEGVDTSAFNVADELYVAPGAGLTNVRPTGSGELVQKIAVVLKKSAGNGAILVYGAGRTNDVPNEISISGIITAAALSVSGNISCAGTITYNDVTNVDSLGIGTFRSGVVVNTGTATTALVVNGDARITGILTIGTSSLTLNGTDNFIQVGTGLTIRDTGDAVYSGVITATTFNSGAITITGQTETDTLNVSGVSTFNANVSIASSVLLGDNNKVMFGDDDDLQIYHTGGTESVIKENGDGPLKILTNRLDIKNSGDANTMASFKSGTNGVDLYYDNSKKFETTSTGIDVTGHTETDTLNVSGLSTFGGRLLIGTTASTTFSNNIQPLQQIRGTGSAGIGIVRDQDNGNPATLFLTKTRGDDTTIVQSGDSLGEIRFCGSDGVDVRSTAARIYAEVNDTPGSNSMPGKLVFGVSGTGDIAAPDRMVIDGLGDVGIGTDNPRNSAKLDVHNSTSNGVYINYDGTSNTDFGLRIESNAAGGNFESDFVNGTAALLDLYANSSTVTGGDLLVARTQSSTPVLLVRGNGNIGIGTNNPLGKVHVESAATTAGWQIRTDSAGLNNESGFYRDANDHYELVLRNGSGGLSYLKNDGGASTANLLFTVQGSERMRITSDGLVGIGTDAPGKKLHVVSSESTSANFESTGSNSSIRFINSTATNVYIGNKDTNNFHISTGGSERVRITSSGVVGIGTDNPSSTSQLHIYDGSAGCDLTITSGNTNAVDINLGDIDDYDVGRIRYNNQNDSMSFRTNGSDNRLRIDSSGDVGIATDSPDRRLHVRGSQNNICRIESSNNNSRIEFKDSGTDSNATVSIGSSGNAFQINTNTSGTGTRRVTVQGDGEILFGTQTRTADSSSGITFVPSTNGRVLLDCGTTNTATAQLQRFFNGNGQVGNIATNGSATAYNTSSDYRLKENITPMVGAADRVKSLKPCRFNFIADDSKTVDGFLAHEVQEVVPESVTGTKDETEEIGTLTEWDGTILETNTPEPDSLIWDETITDEDDNETVETRTRTWVKTGDRPVMQGIDQAKLVPLLTAALQEAIAKIETLEQRLTDAGL